MRHLFFTAAFFGLVFSSVQADVSMPNVFGNHMVLQRDIPCPVYGSAATGEEVTVKFAGQEKKATADARGRWMVKLDAMEANANGQTLEVTAKNTINFTDVLVGDNWVCSGQSNMEWSVGGTLNPAEEIKAAEYPGIRLYNVQGHITSPTPASDASGTWQICSAGSVPGFSAVGYFFGRRLNKDVKIPIGLIGANWGGTRIEPWTPPVGFRMVPELKAIADSVNKFDLTTEEGKATWSKYIADMEAWLAAAKASLASGDGIPATPDSPGPRGGGEPVAIYHGMVSPLVPYGIKGAIWYQGESNGGEGESYYHKTQALVKGWRSVWNQGDFPFYWVQLADFQKSNGKPEGGDGWAQIREAQRKSLTIPNTGMAVIHDIGAENDIHPRNKQDVGDRLAQWALHQTYKQDVVPCGPLFQKIVVEGNKIRIHFDHVGDGLMVGAKEGLAPTKEVPDGKLERFAIAGQDKAWQWAEAVIDGETVVVSCDAIAEPVAVRYGYTMNPRGANLYNKEGLPASSFRSDSW
ncbi:MAG: sialate O-acetylesterase [Planctomycetota bacterium]|nr:sialate O-acetylesterase [Planctomycetota bacterium]MDA1142479.1 sialate O-acetylesterase [Planctomycetota bacterium]